MPSPIIIAFGLIIAIGYELGVLDSLQSTGPFLAGGDVRNEKVLKHSVGARAGTTPVNCPVAYRLKWP